MHNLKLAGLFMALVLLLAACGGGATESNTGAGSDAGTEGTDTGSSAPVAQDVTIEGQDIKYVPADITAQAGQPVNITLDNTGALEHNITWEENDELFIDTQPGESESASRTFEEPGEYGFYCSVAGHKEAGMVGTVTVN